MLANKLWVVIAVLISSGIALSQSQDATLRSTETRKATNVSLI